MLNNYVIRMDELMLQRLFSKIAMTNLGRSNFMYFPRPLVAGLGRKKKKKKKKKDQNPDVVGQWRRWGASDGDG